MSTGEYTTKHSYRRAETAGRQGDWAEDWAGLSWSEDRDKTTLDSITLTGQSRSVYILKVVAYSPTTHARVFPKRLYD